MTCIWLGGRWFSGLAVAAAGIMVWELARIFRADAGPMALVLGLVAAAAVIAGRFLPEWGVAVVLLAPAAVWALTLRTDPWVYGAAAFAICLAAWGLITFRQTYGMVWLFWLVLVVIATDIAGYFVGRSLGGPKFWPRVSPKKTWSGIVGGWLAAALVGALFLLVTDAGRDLVWISSAVSFVSPAWRHRRKRGEAALWGQGQFQPDPRPWRADGPVRRAAGRLAGDAGGGAGGRCARGEVLTGCAGFRSSVRRARSASRRSS